MSIRFPLQDVLDQNNSTIVATGPASTAGGIAYAFNLPQDTDNVVVKLAASVMGGGVSATFQTSDDGGTTFWDVARTSIVSNANATVTAEWLSIPVVGVGVKTTTQIGSIVATGSTISVGSIYGATGRAGASTIGQLTVSGLPIMGPQNRIFMQYTAAVTSVISERITVSANSQSATA